MAPIIIEAIKLVVKSGINSAKAVSDSLIPLPDLSCPAEKFPF